MQVMVNGLLTHYETAGKGPLVLVLHGWGDDSLGWQRVQKYLSRSYKVIVPDLPGFGGTEAPKEAWGLDEYAAFIQSFLTKIDAGKPDVILAHSNGGAVAVRALASRKLQAKTLVLLASAGIRAEYKGKKKVLRIAAKAGKTFLLPLPGKVKDRVRRKAYSTIGSDMFVAEHLQETFKKVVTDDIQHDAPAVSARTLLIYGGHDTATPVRYGQKLAKLMPDATLKVVANAGHFVHNDQFEVVMKDVEGFIA